MLSVARMTWLTEREVTELGKGCMEGWVEEERVLLGQDMCMEGRERIDTGVKSCLRKVMDKRRRWMGLGTRIQ